MTECVDMPTKRPLVGRTDLGMGKQKIAAPVTRAAVATVLRNHGAARFAAWLRGGNPKGVLNDQRRSRADRLRELCAAEAAGLRVERIPRRRANTGRGGHADLLHHRSGV